MFPHHLVLLPFAIFVSAFSARVVSRHAHSLTAAYHIHIGQSTIFVEALNSQRKKVVCGFRTCTMKTKRTNLLGEPSLLDVYDGNPSKTVEASFSFPRYQWIWFTNFAELIYKTQNCRVNHIFCQILSSFLEISFLARRKLIWWE